MYFPLWICRINNHYIFLIWSFVLSFFSFLPKLVHQKCWIVCTVTSCNATLIVVGHFGLQPMAQLGIALHFPVGNIAEQCAKNAQFRGHFLKKVSATAFFFALALWPNNVILKIKIWIFFLQNFLLNIVFVKPNKG